MVQHRARSAAPPPPALHPGTHEPAGPEDFEPLFPMALIMQEVSTDELHRYSPEEFRTSTDVAALAPLPGPPTGKGAGYARPIYYKYEGVSPAGSTSQTRGPQAYYNKMEGVKKLTTETGAGQWGTALAFACALFDLECEVWQVRGSYDAEAVSQGDDGDLRWRGPPEPVDLTKPAGRSLQPNPASPGQLGIAIQEAVEMAAPNPEVDMRLAVVLNHVLMHQTIIGEEALLQLAKVEETPDVSVGCTGGGSNFAGLSFPFMREKMAGQ